MMENINKMDFLSIKAMTGRPGPSEKDLLQHFNTFPVDVSCLPEPFYLHFSHIFTLDTSQ